MNGVGGTVLVLHDTTEFSYRREHVGLLHRPKHGPSGWRHDNPLCGISAVTFWTRKEFKGANELKRHINPTRVPIGEKESVSLLAANRRAMIRIVGKLRIHSMKVFPVIAAAVLASSCFTLHGGTRFVLDPAFKSSILTGDVSPPYDALPLADGTILIAGDFNYLNGAVVQAPVSLDSSGQLLSQNLGSTDPRVRLAVIGSSAVWAALGGGGAVVALPSDATHAAEIVRIYSDGRVDPKRLAVTGGAAQVASLVALPDGSVVACGQFTAIGGQTTLDVAHLRADGSVDTSYTSMTAFLGSYAVGADGSVAGLGGTDSSLPIVQRLNAAGALTDTWNLGNVYGPVLAIGADGAVLAVQSPYPPGWLTLPSLPASQSMTTIYRLVPSSPAISVWFQTSAGLSIWQLVPLPDFSLLIVGTHAQSGFGASPPGLIHIKADATVDPTFDPPGLDVLSVGKLRQTPSGWLAIVNSPDLPTTLRRLQPDLSVAPGFDPDFRFLAYPTSAYPLPDGSVLLAGRFTTPQGSHQFFARLFPDGTVDYNRVPEPTFAEFVTPVVAAVDSAGNIYVVAQTQISVATDGGPLQAPAASGPLLGGGQMERFSIDGVYDAAFGQHALPGSNSVIDCVAVDGQGVLLGGTSAERLTPAGAVDPTFAFTLPPRLTAIISIAPMPTGGYSMIADGDTYLRVAGSGSLFPGALGLYAVRANGVTVTGGKAYLTGDFSDVLNVHSPAVLRLSEDGSPDDGWAAQIGSSSSSGGYAFDAVRALPGNRLLVPGEIVSPTGAQEFGALLLANGAWDTLNNPLPAAYLYQAGSDGAIYGFGLGSIFRLIPTAVPDADPPLAPIVSTPASWITNASALSFTSSGALAQSFAFILSGTSSQPILIRAIGPSLAALGLPNPAGAAQTDVSSAIDPIFSLYSGTETAAQIAGMVGAFPILPSDAEPQVVFMGIGGPPYHVQHAATSPGIGLTELYVPPVVGIPNAQCIANVSARAHVGPGFGPLVVGFVIAGTRPKNVVVRGLGPTLAAFGVGDAVTDPQITVYSGQKVIAANDDWQNQTNPSAMTAAAAAAGAFALQPGKDAALLEALGPGAYTVVFDSKGAAGEGMIEVYDVDR